MFTIRYLLLRINLIESSYCVTAAKVNSHVSWSFLLRNHLLSMRTEKVKEDLKSMPPLMLLSLPQVSDSIPCHNFLPNIYCTFFYCNVVPGNGISIGENKVSLKHESWWTHYTVELMFNADITCRLLLAECPQYHHAYKS